MPTVFSAARGVVSRIDTFGPVAPFQVRMQMSADAASPAIIINQFAIADRVKHQVSTAFDRTHYLYVYGDELTQISVSGVAFGSSCGVAAGGIDGIIAAYRANKMSNRPTAVLLSIGGVPYYGLLVGTNISLVDPERYIAQWTLQFLALPG